MLETGFASENYIVNIHVYVFTRMVCCMLQ